MASTSSPESSTSARSEALRTLVRASLTGDVAPVADLVTEDVVGWSPNLWVQSRGALLAALDQPDAAVSAIELEVQSLDHIGDKAIAEWRVGADHTGPMVVDDDLVIDATGRRLHLSGATVAEFDGEHICAFRSYYDDLALLEQVLVAG